MSSSAAARRVSEPGSERDLGRRGEAAAERYLTRRGFRILERGFRRRCGEIDLVAEQGEALVFVEVKTRSGSGFGHPAEAVTHRKRLRLVRAASVYLQERGGWKRPCRFDLVSVRVGSDGTERIEHLCDSFAADLRG
jgi:putative endonuclease